MLLAVANLMITMKPSCDTVLVGWAVWQPTVLLGALRMVHDAYKSAFLSGVRVGTAFVCAAIESKQLTA